MKRLFIPVLILGLIFSCSIASMASTNKLLIISASSENIWNWQWQPTKTGGRSAYGLLTSTVQAESFIAQLPQPAQETIAAALHQVDFKHNVAIVAYLGARPSAGYQVEIGQITIGNNYMQVWVGRRSPATNDVAAAVNTYPFTVYTLPRQDVPANLFTLEVMDQTGQNLHYELVSLADAAFWDWHWQEGLLRPQVQLIKSDAQARRFITSLPVEQRAAVAETLSSVNYRKEVALMAYLGGGAALPYHKITLGDVRINEEGIQVWLGLQSPKTPTTLPAVNNPFAMMLIPRRNIPRQVLPLTVYDQTGRIWVP